MCETIGISNTADLFRTIPENFRLKTLLDLPQALSEPELMHHLVDLSHQNKTVSHTTSFLGAGAYHHYIPSVVGQLILRGEFLTSYTPYQPEISQGTLQAIFEFQTMIASLLGLEIANASTYEGATSLAEAVLMAVRIQRKKQEVILAQTIHPEYREVVKTTLKNLGYPVREIGWNEKGQLSLDQLKENLSEKTAVLCVQSPNFFGVVEDLKSIGKLAHEAGALFVGVSGDPVSLGVLESPGKCGADIAVSEGQSFGNSLSFGGPYLGLFAAKKEYLRQMPGRLVGETQDAAGERGFVLTFNTREQHIRREKATSNICTNQSLCALAAAIHLSLLGPQGLRKLAEINLSKAHYAKKLLSEIPGVRLPLSGPTFHEFVIELPKPVDLVLSRLLEKNIFGGLSLEKFYPELNNALLVCVTEMVSKEEIDRFASEIMQILSAG